MSHRRLPSSLLAPGLSGCILGSERPELNLEFPTAYREAPKSSVDAAVPALDWWRGFRSKELTTLMEDAHVFNLDIAVAIAQVVQADAQVGVSGISIVSVNYRYGDRRAGKGLNRDRRRRFRHRSRLWRRWRLDVLAITMSASPRAT